MAVQLKSSRSKFRIPAAVGAVVVGSYIVLKTFPHLKDSIYFYLTGTPEDVEDNEPIELKKSENTEDQARDVNAEPSNESGVEVSQWTDNRLREWLKDVSIL